MTLSDLLAQVCIVLVKPSHPGNVGAAARALKTMGFAQLRLVSPKVADVHVQADAVSLASGAVDVLHNAAMFSSLADALHDCHLAYALTARSRELQPRMQGLEDAALEAATWVTSQLERSLNPASVSGDANPMRHIAFVFGCERTGLSNDEVLTCNRCVTIDGNPEYGSLNLAQAVQVVAYEVRRTLNGVLQKSILRETSQVDVVKMQLVLNHEHHANQVLASVQAVHQLHVHWAQAMEKVGFIRPDKPKKALERLQLILAKAQLSPEEVDMLRGFCADVIRVAEGRLYQHEIHRHQIQRHDQCQNIKP